MALLLASLLVLPIAVAFMAEVEVVDDKNGENEVRVVRKRRLLMADAGETAAEKAPVTFVKLANNIL